jgi:hypothetical protein
MRIFLVFFFLLSPSGARSEDSLATTFYIDLQSAPQVQYSLLMQNLGTKCYRIQDLSEQVDSKGDTSIKQACHIFKVFEGETKVQGDFPAKGTSYLAKIRYIGRAETHQWRYQVSLMNRKDGKKLVPFLNAGEFRFPSDHQLKNGDKDFSQDRAIRDLARTVVGLTFK